MPGDPPDEPSLSADERRQLARLEGRLAADDPALDYRLRTGRGMPRKVNPVHAGIAATVIALLVPLIFMFWGPAAGVIAAAVAVTGLPLGLLVWARLGSPGGNRSR